jgi:hypothetical protein
MLLFAEGDKLDEKLGHHAPQERGAMVMRASSDTLTSLLGSLPTRSAIGSMEEEEPAVEGSGWCQQNTQQRQASESGLISRKAIRAITEGGLTCGFQLHQASNPVSPDLRPALWL